MKFLILSDVHGNKYGLQAVLEAGAGCDAVLCLGDIVGYGANPNECCEILRDCDAQCLSGNHDAAALGKIDSRGFNPVAKRAIEWTQQQLAPDNVHWLNGLPAHDEWPRYRFEAVHASLKENWLEYITEFSVAIPTLERMQFSLCFYGHTHRSDMYSCPDIPGGEKQVHHRDTPFGASINLERRTKYLVNPGSCGQPRDGNPQAKYAVFDTKLNRVEIFQCEYDIQAARQDILYAGLPVALGDRLLEGR